MRICRLAQSWSIELHCSFLPWVGNDQTSSISVPPITYLLLTHLVFPSFLALRRRTFLIPDSSFILLAVFPFTSITNCSIHFYILSKISFESPISRSLDSILSSSCFWAVECVLPRILISKSNVQQPTINTNTRNKSNKNSIKTTQLLPEGWKLLPKPIGAFYQNQYLHNPIPKHIPYFYSLHRARYSSFNRVNTLKKHEIIEQKSQVKVYTSWDWTHNH